MRNNRSFYAAWLLVLGGIILGPSVMGRIPNYMNTVFPTASLPYLNLIATIGLVFFLFQVGLEVDVKLIKRDVRKSLTVGIMGMALPFAMGVAVSYGLYRLQNDPTIPFGSYLLFLGVAMSITVSTWYLDICRSHSLFVFTQEYAYMWDVTVSKSNVSPFFFLQTGFSSSCAHPGRIEIVENKCWCDHNVSWPAQ